MTRREFAISAIGLPKLAAVSVSWIAVSLREAPERSSYADADRAVSVGSLLKPFLAIAYLRSRSRAPVVECRGVEQGCWKPGGHGRLELSDALAVSCNVYFLQVARDLSKPLLDSVCLSYGLVCPVREWSGSRLIGVGPGWPQGPRALVRAYLRMARDGADSSVQPVLKGMALSASRGTAKAAGFACYGKTGTAACSHRPGGAGDGYAVALFPLGQPRHALLVMQHNRTGAQAAGALKPVAMSLGE